MKILVGNTGLIGITLKENLRFDFEFNSKNINDFERLVNNGCEVYLSCLPATKWIVNTKINEDMDNIIKLINILKTKTYSKIFLISTIDVYNDSPLKSNEDYKPNINNLNYGTNRFFFELMVRKLITSESIKIFRLPALFSKNIKKNIIYDLINNNNVNNINVNSKYQWYNLNKLVKDIEYFSTKYPNQDTYNFFTEPLETKKIIDLFPNLKNIVTHFDKEIIYDYTTKFGVYLEKKEVILNEIKELVDEFSGK